MYFHFSILFLSIKLVSAFQWPWQDETTTGLQSALPTSTNRNSIPLVNSGSGSGISGSTTWSFSLSYYAQGQAYAPKSTECPSTPILREASNISQKEDDYIRQRYVKTNKKLITFLNDVANLSDFDAEEFLTNADRNITIGLAFSGGGYRAMLSGAGSLLALDDRFQDLSKTALGGLLQSSTYITGLSGGSWLVGSLAVNNWISVADILQEDSGMWDLSDLIFNPSGINIVSTISYYNQLREAIGAKKDSGFETSITDVWGRALSYQFFNDTFYHGGENFTWTGITQLPSFQDHDMPFPIIVANGRNPGSKIINLNSTVFEITPYELGSWDTSLNSFIINRYLGTSLDNGTPNDTFCVTNFDNAGYFMGTSSSIFNQILFKVESLSTINWALKKLLSLILGSFLETDSDIATYEPNPFYNSEYADLKSLVSSRSLNLVDGGEDDQNIPYYPLIQNNRNVDVIFSYDNSADTPDNWPNGSAITYTFKRQFTIQGYGTPFPYVPPFHTFIDEKLNKRPVFFGCNASQLSSLVEFHGSKKNTTDVPLVVYIPASQYLYEANTSTYKMSYDNEEKFSMITNGYEVMSLNNRTHNKTWNKCIGCAIIRREQERRGEEQSEECKECFENYCWNGGIQDSAEPNALALLNIVAQSISLEVFKTGNSSVHSIQTSVNLTHYTGNILSSSTGNISSLQTNESTSETSNIDVPRSSSTSGAIVEKRSRILQILLGCLLTLVYTMS